MKKLYILKAGTALQEVVKTEGDFHNLIIKKSGIPASSCVTITNFSYYHYRVPPDAGGFIITGSHAMVTDNKPWILQLSRMVRGIASSGIPLLGICFGHQVIATALGGEVENLPAIIEIGTANIRQEAQAYDDMLLKNLPYSFKAFTSHRQTVKSLPDGARSLGFSKLDKHQAVCYRQGLAWGVQFHPEFNINVTKTYINHFRDVITGAGNNPDEMIQNLKPDTHGEVLLQAFCNICQVM